jgi:hypothetical protein
LADVFPPEPVHQANQDEPRVTDPVGQVG